MNGIFNILFVISNGLLIPVVLILLYLLCKALIIVVGFYNEYRKQKLISSAMQEITHNYSYERLVDTDVSLGSMSDAPVVSCLRDMVAHKDDRIYCEHTLADFQVEVQKILSKNRMLIKFGPMLGLMGTLIPMGPALVGLAVGDIASMAYNMQVAFATTVIGMLVAGIGLATLQVNQRFYARSFNALEFIYLKITER
ncbi:MAG: MotA/TolQ/ExbB proton channel family protein [Muribaculaceae bacterium]|nr:MotA/TolQ/ExbB proton channel family protein [Muribaculaceae bacterium]